MFGNYESGRYIFRDNIRKSREIGYSIKILVYIERKFWFFILKLYNINVNILFLSIFMVLGLCFFF